MPVLAILFDKNLYSLSDEQKWVDNHGFIPLKQGKLEGNYYRFRLIDPKEITQCIKFILGWKNRVGSSQRKYNCYYHIDIAQCI